MNQDSPQPKVKVEPGGGTRPQTRGSALHRLSTDPFLDWLFILGVNIVLLAGLIVVGIYVYLDTGRTLSTSVDASNKKGLDLPIDKAAIASVLREFERRSAEREALGKSYSAPKDPTLP